MVKEWLCKGPSGTHGEGIVGNGWHKCFRNFIKITNNNCEISYPTEQEAKQFCKDSLVNEIDIKQDNFNPKKYSCIIHKDDRKCEGNYIALFQKNKPHSYYDINGDNHNMMINIMDIKHHMYNYKQQLETDELKKQAIEMQKIRHQQKREQQIIEQKRIIEEKERKRKIFKQTIEDELKHEIKQEIVNEIGGEQELGDEIIQSLKSKISDSQIKQIEHKKFSKEIKKIESEMNKHSHDEKNMNMDNISKQIVELKNNQIKTEVMVNNLLKQGQTTYDIDEMLDNTEKFLIKILSEPSQVESFSRKPSRKIWIMIFVVCILIYLFICYN
jgi:hypothetical protein